MVQYRSDNKTMYSTVQSPTAHAGFVSVSVSVSGLRLRLRSPSPSPSFPLLYCCPSLTASPWRYYRHPRHVHAPLNPHAPLRLSLSPSLGITPRHPFHQHRNSPSSRPNHPPIQNAINRRRPTVHFLRPAQVQRERVVVRRIFLFAAHTVPSARIPKNKVK